MNLCPERVAHLNFQKNESCSAFPMITGASVKGEFAINMIMIKKDLMFFSYDGYIFHSQADSKYGHFETTLAKFEEAPLALGGYSPNNNKAERFDIASNTWTEVETPYYGLYRE